MKKIKIETKHKIVIAVFIIILCVLFAWTSSEDRIGEGILVQVAKYPTHDGGNDVVLLFNNSGSYKYVVINEWKTGIMVELDNQVGNNIKITYRYYPLQDKNVIVDWE